MALATIRNLRTQWFPPKPFFSHRDRSFVPEWQGFHCCRGKYWGWVCADWDSIRHWRYNLHGTAIQSWSRSLTNAHAWYKLTWILGQGRKGYPKPHRKISGSQDTRPDKIPSTRSQWSWVCQGSSSELCPTRTQTRRPLEQCRSRRQKCRDRWQNSIRSWRNS
jgi:hypothetical protein